MPRFKKVSPDFNGTFTDDEGRQIWYKDGKFHRDGDEPAILYPSGARCWYREGEMHRDDGPAFIDAYGQKEWYQNGKLHRDDGPAVERYEIKKRKAVLHHWTFQWYRNGERHRDGAPALDSWNGHRQWWQNGKLHREDGPAMITSKGYEEYYLNGVSWPEGPEVMKARKLAAQTILSQDTPALPRIALPKRKGPSF